MNHKRGRPKNSRAGCLLCKGWKMNGARPETQLKASERRKLQEEGGVEEATPDAPACAHSDPDVAITIVAQTQAAGDEG